MTTETDGSDYRHPEDAELPPLDRYSVVVTRTDALIIYDEAEEDAWIQSDRWVSLLRRE